MGKLEPVDPERVEELRNMIALARDEAHAAASAVQSAQERRRAADALVNELIDELGAYVYPAQESQRA